ncbi:MAG TPA: biotin carboxylase N-terminal domain-containing protein [Methylomirabilota bacterium]|nr:biotin carboxylase N-terminal domain-containing protein [Methylomirabilota bacterium]
MFGTVLVANRGEIARRVFRACKALGLRTVAVYSQADRDATHVRDADSAVEIGGAPARESYLDAERILDAARRSGADAIHPGYGFLSESWRFAEAVRHAGIVFIGPTPAAIRTMGDKIEARRLMSAAGVSVLPGSFDPVADVAAAEAIAGEIGYPVILKAAAGGGGIGMARVGKPTDLATAFAAANRRAQAAFGTGELYVERYLERPRHVEVQVFGDEAGNVVHMHERECSIQRRHQKLVEESPAPGLAPATKAGLTAAAVAGARAIGYTNAGTMEFLVDESGGFYFLEMNARLQVEHPVTEEVTGLDLVVAQLRAAAGEPLPWAQGQIVQRRAAIECRVYAEDPSKGFLPSPGTVQKLELPSGEGIRIESGVEPGSTVSVHYDPLLLKLIAHGDTRRQAIERLADALDRSVIEGVRTTIPFLRRVVASDEFRQGRVHTQMLEQGAFNA